MEAPRVMSASHLHPCHVAGRDNEARKTAGRVGTWESMGSGTPGGQIRNKGKWDLGQAVLLEVASWNFAAQESRPEKGKHKSMLMLWLNFDFKLLG